MLGKQNVNKRVLFRFRFTFNSPISQITELNKYTYLSKALQVPKFKEVPTLMYNFLVHCAPREAEITT